jgi:putative addiction module component (TIGR02574 family)
MNKRLDEVIARVKELPDDEQQQIAELILEILANQQPDAYLTPEQIAEIERRMSDDEPYATEEEVRAVFDRLTK